jgi:hypothetical protein
MKADAGLRPVRERPSESANRMPPRIEPIKAHATEQETSDLLRETLGSYSNPAESSRPREGHIRRGTIRRSSQGGGEDERSEEGMMVVPEFR